MKGFAKFGRLLIVVLLFFAVFTSKSPSRGLLEDSDTHVLLVKIREVGDPLRWFQGDWPLENHFYRPISTLAFEFDNAIGGDRPEQYATTNAFLAAICVPLLIWFVWELFGLMGLALCSGAWFACCILGYETRLTGWLGLLALPVLVIGAWRHGRDWQKYVPVALAIHSLPLLLPPPTGLWFRMIGWIPGRTASVMTVFVLIALAAYARYERLSAHELPKPEPGPHDPPATRSTQVRVQKSAVGWAVTSLVAVALSLGSYEQAVMLPACLLGSAIVLRWQRFRVRWGWQAGFWSLLFGYLVLRRVLLPAETSGYQEQQLRFGPGVMVAILEYVFPVASNYTYVLTNLTTDPLLYLTAGPWQVLLRIAGEVAAYFEARREWMITVAGYLLSVISFLPMAWLQPFDHYHFWPIAMRSLASIGLMMSVWRSATIAVGHPKLQAPLRSNPAPGSLPHP